MRTRREIDFLVEHFASKLAAPHLWRLVAFYLHKISGLPLRRVTRNRFSIWKQFCWLLPLSRLCGYQLLNTDIRKLNNRKVKKAELSRLIPRKLAGFRLQQTYSEEIGYIFFIKSCIFFKRSNPHSFSKSFSPIWEDRDPAHGSCADLVGCWNESTDSFTPKRDLTDAFRSGDRKLRWSGFPCWLVKSVLFRRCSVGFVQRLCVAAELLLLQIVNVVCLIFGTPLVASM